MSKWTNTIDALANQLRQQKIDDKLRSYYQPLAVLLEKKGSQTLELPITDCKKIVITFNTKNIYVIVEEQFHTVTTYHCTIEIRDKNGKLYRNWKNILFNRIVGRIENRLVEHY
jgi:hypothetical protein